MKTCCELSEWNKTVHYNPYNKVVQCHSCGRVWVPRNFLNPFRNCKSDVYYVSYFYDTHEYQCCRCGEIWVPASKLVYLLNRLFKWW